MKVSISTRTFCKTPVEDTIRLARQIGYDGIELWVGEPQMSADKLYSDCQHIGDILKQYDMELASIETSIGGFSTESDRKCREQLGQLEKILMATKRLPCSMIEIDPGGPNSFNAKGYQYHKSIYWVKRCADLAAEYNCTLLLGVGNGTLIDRIEAATKYMDKLKRDNVGLVHDAGKLYMADTDYSINSIGLLGDYILHVRVRDMIRVDNDIEGSFHSRTIYGNEIFKYLPLGEGALDYVSLFKGLIENQYSGFISSAPCFVDSGVYSAQDEFEELKRQIRLAEELC